MKKTTSITIGGRRFYLEEEGYSTLHDYLESLRAYFAAHRDFDEIISDIESRIAERFAELQASANAPAIATEHVTELIGTIGKPADIGEGNDVDDPLAGSYPRRLFRDLDHGLLAGVCAGLGSYLKLDPNVIRVAFALAALLSGLGILVYLVFWLVIPPARTSTERLSMHGAPLTLASLTSLFSMRKNTPSDREGVDKMIAMPFNAAKRGATAVSGATQSIVSLVLPLLKRIAAFAFIIGGALAILLVCFGFALAMAWFPASYFDPTVMEFIDSVPRRALALSSALTLLIPAVFILALGVAMLRKQSILQPAVGFGLIAVWSVALVTTGVLGVRTGLRWQTFEVNHPAYQRTTVTFDSPMLISVDATGTRTTVRLVESSVRAVTMEGRRKDIDRLVHTVENGALRIVAKPGSRQCVECDIELVRVTVTAPATDSIIFLSPVERIRTSRVSDHDLKWLIGLPVALRRAYDVAIEAVRDFGFTVIDSSAADGRFRTAARATVPAPGDPAAPLTFPDSVMIEVSIRSASPTSVRLDLNVATPSRVDGQETESARQARGTLATIVTQRMKDYARRPR